MRAASLSRNAVAGPEMRSRSRNAGRGSRNAGQLEENAVTHLRLSKMHVAGCRLRDASYESRDASCDCQMSRDWGILGRTFVPL